MSPAFNTLAGIYDETFTHTLSGRLQRLRVWHFTQQQLRHLETNAPNALELNCGTGEDALWLARQGFRVLATDIAPEMVAVAQKKAAATPEAGQIAVAVCDIAQLGTWLKNTGSTFPLSTAMEPTPQRFDLVFSNFGGLNCLPPADLATLGLAAKAALLPGGRFVAVLMGRFCFWETFYFLAKGRPKQAFRRLRRGPVVAPLDAQHTVHSWYYTPRAFADFFPDFEISAIHPIGLWLPPSYLDPFFRRFPRLLAFLNRLETISTAGFWARGADHYFISFVRTAEPRSAAL